MTIALINTSTFLWMAHKDSTELGVWMRAEAMPGGLRGLQPFIKAGLIQQNKGSTWVRMTAAGRAAANALTDLAHSFTITATRARREA